MSITNYELRITNWPAWRSGMCFRHTNVRRQLLLLLFIFILPSSFFIASARAQGNVGIGTTSPNSSALLDLTSTSLGVLVPRMTEAQKYAIASPATGLLIYQTNTQDTGTYANQAPTFWYYNGSRWIPLLGAAWQLTGNSGTSPSTNFIGTTDSVDWIIRTNDTERVRVYAGGNVGLRNFNNTAEEIRFFTPSSAGSYYTGWKSDIDTSSTTYIWPPYNGDSSNWVLCTDGFGDLTWRGFGASGGGGIDTMWTRGTGTLALVGHGAGNISSGNYSISSGYHNTASGAGTVVWGEDNLASGYASVVAGGFNDTASGNYSTVGGGQYNTASGSYSSVVSGEYNTACGTYAVVLGGQYNKACGTYATVLGGYGNTASGNYSLAFGVGANVTTDNTIVYYDSISGNPMEVGIGNTTPTQALDVTGNIRFSGTLKPNNLAGTTGYVLTSLGSNTAPIWDSTGNFYWRTWGNTGTSTSYNYLGTSDANALVFKTNATERMRILTTGQVGINTTTPTHQLQSVYSGTTDEVAAVLGHASAATSNQAIGVWGSASGTSGTGTIGVLATGNGNTTAGQTNVALQINDGELDMGRTTQSPSVGSAVEAATAGTSYSQQGPSGVIELTLGGGNLATVAPINGVFEDLGTVTINNRYCSSSSIVLVSVVSKIDDGVSPDCRQAVYFVDATSRASGSFTIRIGMIPTVTDFSNYSTSDKIRIGYTIINPGR